MCRVSVGVGPSAACQLRRSLPPLFPVSPRAFLPSLPARCTHRGAHTFFLRQGEVQRWGGYTVNLIHYEDAASLCLAALQGRGSADGAPYRGRVFLGCDGTPVTFEDMMAATLDCPAFEGSVTFTGPEGPVKGKRMSNGATRTQLQWEPKYPSYAQFMRESGAKDWYSEQEAAAVAGMPHA